MKGADDMAVVRVGGDEAVAPADGGSGGCMRPHVITTQTSYRECRLECIGELPPTSYPISQ
jgi:hypothetical protein